MIFMPKIEKESQIQYDPKGGCGRSRQADHRETCVRLYTHEVCHRQSDQERLADSLEHDKECFSISAIVPDKAKQYAGDNGFRTESF